MANEIIIISDGKNALTVEGQTYLVKNLFDAQEVLLVLIKKFGSGFIRALSSRIPPIIWENVTPVDDIDRVIETTMINNASLRDQILAKSPDEEVVNETGLNSDDVVRFSVALILNMAEKPGNYNFLSPNNRTSQ